PSGGPSARRQVQPASHPSPVGRGKIMSQRPEGGRSMSRKPHHHAIVMPSEVTPTVGFFDTFAGSAARLASRAPFFAFCLLLVILWLVQGGIIVATGGLHRSLASQYQPE